MSHVKETILLTKADFDALPEYSASLPTGTSVGRRWKRKYIDRGGVVRWTLGEYTESIPVPTCCRYHRCIAGYIDDTPCSVVKNYNTGLVYDPAHPELWPERPNELMKIKWRVIELSDGTDDRRREFPVHLL